MVTNILESSKDPKENTHAGKERYTKKRQNGVHLTSGTGDVCPN